MALGRRKRIPWLLASFGDFERREHAPRSSTGAQTCASLTSGPPACPAAKSTRKDLRPEEKILAMCKNEVNLVHIYSNICILVAGLWHTLMGADKRPESMYVQTRYIPKGMLRRIKYPGGVGGRTERTEAWGSVIESHRTYRSVGHRYSVRTEP